MGDGSSHSSGVVESLLHLIQTIKQALQPGGRVICSFLNAFLTQALGILRNMARISSSYTFNPGTERTATAPPFCLRFLAGRIRSPLIGEASKDRAPVNERGGTIARIDEEVPTCEVGMGEGVAVTDKRFKGETADGLPRLDSDM